MQLHGILLPATFLAPNSAGWVRYVFEWGPWLFSALLVVVGFLQVWLLQVTWKTIERQTRLLQFAQRQWLDIGNWTVDKEEAAGTDCYPDHLVDCTFELFNNTRRATTNVFVMHSGTEGRTYEVTENLMLPPGNRSSGYVVRVPVTMSDSQFKLYRQKKLFVSFQGTIGFLGPEGTEVQQHFQQLALLNPGKVELWRSHGAVPDELAYAGSIWPPDEATK